MSQINLFFKSLSGDTFKIGVFQNSTILQLKEQILKKKNKSSTDSVKLMFKGKELTDDQSVEQSQLTNGDMVIFTIKSMPQQQQFSQHPMNKEKILTGEAYRKSVEDLIDLGFKREDVIAAFKNCDQNLKKTLQFLINNERRKFIQPEIDEEDQTKIINQEQIQAAKVASLKSNPLIKELIESTRSSPEQWQKTLIRIQQTNANFYIDIVDNYYELIEAALDKKQEPVDIITEVDSEKIVSIQNIVKDSRMQDIIQSYINNNKNPYDTIFELNDKQKQI